MVPRRGEMSKRMVMRGGHSGCSRVCLKLMLCSLVTEATTISLGSFGPRASPTVWRVPRGFSMGLVRQVTTAEFEEEILDSSTPILVDFMADWCSPCQAMVPQLEEVAQRMDGRVRFLKVDSDVEVDVATSLQIQSLPTVLLINEMSVIMRAEGTLMADEIEQLICRSLKLDDRAERREQWQEWQQQHAGGDEDGDSVTSAADDEAGPVPPPVLDTPTSSAVPAATDLPVNFEPYVPYGGNLPPRPPGDGAVS